MANANLIIVSGTINAQPSEGISEKTGLVEKSLSLRIDSVVKEKTYSQTEMVKIVGDAARSELVLGDKLIIEGKLRDSDRIKNLKYIEAYKFEKV